MKQKSMLQHNPRIGWWCAVMVLSLAASAACRKDAGTGNIGNSALLPPTVNDLPRLTNKAELSVSGTRSINSVVFVEVNAAEAVQVSDQLAIGFWDGKVGLEEGENKLIFHARNLAGTRSAPAPTITVVLDTIPPAPPTLKEPAPPCVQDTYTLEGTLEEGAKLFVDGVESDTEGRNFSLVVQATEQGVTVVLTAKDAAGNESEPVEVTLVRGLEVPTLDEFPEVTNALSVTLSGSKIAGMGVTLRREGQDEAEFIVEPNGDTAWEHEFALEVGPNTFFLSGRTIDGEDSCAESGPHTIIQSSLCPPVITNRDELPAATNRQPVQVELSRCEDVSTFVVVNEQETEDAVLVADAAAGLAIVHALGLVEGDNTVRYFNRDEAGQISPPATLEIEFDTLPPNAPRFNPEPPETFTEASIELRGTKDSGVNLCGRLDPNPDCEEVIPFNSSTSFRFDQELALGNNNVCISSFDRAGNVSPETCAAIERLRSIGPEIVIQEPSNGAPINNNPFTVRAFVTDEAGLNQVEICFDGRRDCRVVTSANDIFTRTITPGNLENGNSYTVTVNATNRGNVSSQATVTVFYITSGLLLSNSRPEAFSERAQIVVDGLGRVHAFWADECSQFEGCDEAPSNLPFDIFHRMFDGDTGWSPIALISDDDNDSESEAPAIAVDLDGNVHIVWQDNGNILGSGFDYDLFHRVFSVNDDSWSDIELITEGSDIDDRSSSLAVGGDGSLHVVWERRTNEDSGEDFDIFYSRNTGSGWSAAIKVSTDAGNNRSGNAQVVADSAGMAYIVWQDNGDILGSGTDTDIYLKTYDGESFSETYVVSNNALDGLSLGPKLAMGPDDRLHIVWEDTATLFNSGTDLDIFYRSFTSDGLNGSFDGNYRLISNDPNDGDSQESDITINPNTGDVFVAWVDLGNISGSGGDPDIFFARSFGGIFGSTTLVSAGSDFAETSEFPDLAYDDANNILHFVWEDDSTIVNDGNDRDIFYLGIQLEE